MTNIVVIGGGAGGMELLGKISKKLGKRGKANITLVDISSHHIWKPLLHELAAGSLDEGLNAVDYRVQAAQNSYNFEQGALTGVDRENRNITLAAMKDQHGNEILPERHVDYDYLVIGIGAITNDFGIPGVREHCDFLDLTEQAMNIRQKILNRFLQHAKNPEQGHFDITIVGAGATGTEMAAEMHHVADTLSGYGYEIAEDLLRVNLIEAADRVMPGLKKECLYGAVDKQLRALGVNIMTNTSVTQVTPEGMHTKEGLFIKSDMMIWAAGVKGPDVLGTLGLEVNKMNQLMVYANCQTTTDERIFSFGDCAACPQPDGSFTPARGQTARQMALLVGDNLIRILKDKDAELKEYLYKDLGGFVNMSKFYTVGNMFSFIGGGIAIKGCPARFVYASLYRRHMLALHGPIKGLLLMGLNGMQSWLRPQLKLW
ncbi:NAD(P)/FAD-dependent oxidoreductase [Shewanella frigidimarina]|uniref:NAD(P)/FAD-dependent oxidoreductase n=1 Tax=Shewanella frigidimarina TaxID=56812 RepID=UPI003D798029